MGQELGRNLCDVLRRGRSLAVAAATIAVTLAAATIAVTIAAAAIAVTLAAAVTLATASLQRTPACGHAWQIPISSSASVPVR